jgi:hypothetical protein
MAADDLFEVFGDFIDKAREGLAAYQRAAMRSYAQRQGRRDE